MKFRYGDEAPLLPSFLPPTRPPERVYGNISVARMNWDSKERENENAVIMICCRSFRDRCALYPRREDLLASNFVRTNETATGSLVQLLSTQRTELAARKRGARREIRVYRV